MRILYVTTISLTMNSFFGPHVQMLVEQGDQVDVACNFRALPLDSLYEKLGCRCYQVDFSRCPLSLDNLRAFFQLKQVVKAGNYDVVHCHTPNAAAITRLACRHLRGRMQVFYTAHGFHFYRGAPLWHWGLLYPIEKFCSRFTDVLITVNREDEELARRKFHAGKVCRISGVGVERTEFSDDRAATRRALGIPQDATVLLSVGELNRNKNHKTAIRAIAGMDVYYLIAGQGTQAKALQQLSRRLGMGERVRLLGYRDDVDALCRAADLFLFPSRREGLALSVLEAMAAGLPVVCSRIRGNVDLIEEPELLFDPTSVRQCRRAIQNALAADRAALGQANRQKAARFSRDVILRQLSDLYQGTFRPE